MDYHDRAREPVYSIIVEIHCLTGPGNLWTVLLWTIMTETGHLDTEIVKVCDQSLTGSEKPGTRSILMPNQ